MHDMSGWDIWWQELSRSLPPSVALTNRQIGLKEPCRTFWNVPWRLQQTCENKDRAREKRTLSNEPKNGSDHQNRPNPSERKR